MRITPIKVKNLEETSKLMTAIGVSAEGIKILSLKSIYCAFKIENIKSWEANILKQYLLSLGSDAAIERNALVKDIETTAFIFGSLKQLKTLCGKLRNQPFRLQEISQIITTYLDNIYKKDFKFYARGKLLKIKDPIICGIINVTYDSFSGDGLIQRGQNTEDKVKYLALKKCENMIKQGVKIIDLGGESSRPFSTPIKGVEEAKNVIPILKAIRNEFKKVFISIDTYKYLVAKKAVDEGVDIINDITAFRGDKRMLNLVKKNDLGCVLMHMKGIPQTMQEKVTYEDTVAEIIEFFNERLNFCFKKGIKKEHVLIDPGIGFGKRQEDNLRIMKELYKLKIFGLPIFLGLSRKSFIGNILNNKVEDRLIGTMAANVISLIKGANILRVHDVKETMQVIKISSAIMNN